MEQIQEATQNLILRMHLDYGQDQPPTNTQRAMVASWCEHFRENGIPAAALGKIYSAVIQTKQIGMMPTIGDLISVWHKKTHTNYLAASHKEYKPLRALPPTQSSAGHLVAQYARKRWKAGMDAVTCNCGQIAFLTGDKKYFCCEKRVCDFRKPVEKLMEIRVFEGFTLRGNLAKPSEKRHRNAPKEELNSLEGNVDGKDEYLVSLLQSRCEMDVTKIEKEEAVAFGRYLEKEEPLYGKWNRELAQSVWKRFRESAKAVAG